MSGNDVLNLGGRTSSMKMKQEFQTRELQNIRDNNQDMTISGKSAMVFNKPAALLNFTPQQSKASRQLATPQSAYPPDHVAHQKILLGGGENLQGIRDDENFACATPPDTTQGH
mmetsp:Transcript_32990/g.50493  ORF Transcript_32990/g.50493 Transcript_32990/m.50493 type:complete len:114 (+) Transcript_32990:1241-1582(+)